MAFASCMPKDTPPSEGSSTGIQIPSASGTSFTTSLFDFIDERDIEKMDALYDQGHPIDTLDEEGFTLLHRAVMEQSVSIVDWLLKRGADPSGSPSVQVAPLSLAINKAKLVLEPAIELSRIYRIMGLLIKAGADPMAHYNNQPSAIQHAMDIQCEPCISFMRRASLSRASDLAN